MSAEKKVITIKGEELPISQCRKFNNVWYKIGNINIEESGDCYLIEGRYHRIETGLHVYNHSLKKYVLYNASVIKGVVNIIDNKLIYGHFNNDKTYSRIIDKAGNIFCIFDIKVIERNREYRERLSNGDFYHTSKLLANRFKMISAPSIEYKNSLPYDSKGIIKQNLKNYNENYNPEISTNIKKYAPLLEKLTFGLEFETIKGTIPKRILEEYGLIPLRDGSITGIEYVTVPMSGEKGLQCTNDILSVLKERTLYDDKSCSLHLHLGGVPRTKEFITAFFKVGMSVQDEMFSMFPLYKKYNYGIKNKNYTAPLPTFSILSQLDPVINSENINDNFNVIYKYLSMGESFSNFNYNLDNVKHHPLDPNGNQKWLIKSRYNIYNLIPLMFGNKQTIEFRIHTPTYEVNKIIPFILMNSLLVNFTIKHQEAILKNEITLDYINLNDIIISQTNNHTDIGLNKIQDVLINYVRSRKKACENQTKRGNILGTEKEISCMSGIDWATTEKEPNNHKIKFSYSLPTDSSSYTLPLNYNESNLFQNATINTDLNNVNTGSGVSFNPPSFDAIVQELSYFLASEDMNISENNKNLSDEIPL